ncbi:MAG: M23 family metallopeptidase [Lachnospiraceae bacterium]|nr:M23 family metallopeptidase [Lachnospiraceae bacterium]
MGRAVSGEEPVGDSLQEAYAAVFDLAPQQEEQDTNDPPEVEPDDTPDPVETKTAPADVGAVLLRQSSALTLPEADKEAMRELVISGEAPASLPAGEREVPAESEPPEDEEAVAAMSQVYTMAALPENASLEQRILGFAHCTPVPGRLSSTFGWREHPIEGGDRFHYGVDLAAETGTDILAFADGEVYASGESSTLGNYIMLRHEDGYITLYAHCSKVTATGGKVAMGEKIAEVGSTGLATGPHLHFELHDGDLYLNPIYYVAVE